MPRGQVLDKQISGHRRTVEKVMDQNPSALEKRICDHPVEHET